MKQEIILGASAVLISAVIILFRHIKNEKNIRRDIYHLGKEEGIKEQMFRTKAYPPPPKVIANELKKWDKFRDAALQWLGDMLLYNKILLQDIPQDIRISSSIIYVMAFRISSRRAGTCERFIKDLNTMCEDICSLDDESDKDRLLSTFSTYLNLNEHTEDESFVNFKNNLCEEILWELRKHRRISQYTFEEQLKNHRIK